VRRRCSAFRRQGLRDTVWCLEKFAYVGVYSSGVLGIVPRSGRDGARPPTPAPGPSWEVQHLAELDNARARKGVKLLAVEMAASESPATIIEDGFDLASFV